MWKHQSSFAVGEVAPNSFGRMDLPFYEQSCRLLDNAILDEYGSPFKRYGSRYVTTSTGPAKLYLFRYDDVVRVAEVTQANIRLLDLDGNEVWTQTPQDAPWLADELEDLYVTSAFPGRLYFCHPNYEPRILRFLPDGSIRFGILIFNDQDPVLDPRTKSQTLSTEEDGTTDTLVTARDFFLGDDLDTYWRFEAGWLKVTEFDGSRVVKYDDLDTSNAVPNPATTTDWSGPWRLSESATPTETLTFQAGVTGDTISITGFTGHGLAEEDHGQILRFLAPPSPTELICYIVNIPNDISLNVKIIGGDTGLGGDFSASWEVYRIKDRESRDNALLTTVGQPQVGQTVTLYCTEAVFSADMIAGPGDDRNAVLTYNQGQVRLSEVTSPNRAVGTVKSRLAETDPTIIWGQGWSLHTGFPTCVAEHQNRLMFAGFDLFPNLIIGTRTQKPQNFRLGGLDDDGLNLQVSGDRNNRIRWMESAGDLLVGTEENEFALRGQPLTPTQLGVDLQHSHGGAAVKPQNVGAATLFVTTGSEIREMVFRFDRDQYLAPDITNFSRHLFNDPMNPVRQLEYVRDPEPLVLARQLDNTVHMMTYRRDDPNNVVGWSRTSISANSLARVPRNGREEVWMSVTREIDGQTVHYIEALEPGGPEMDSWIEANVSGIIVDGLDHLEGQEVSIRGAEGEYFGNKTVQNGRVSGIVGQTAFVGLPYSFRLTPQVLFQRDFRGEQPGRRRRLNFARIRLYNSLGGSVVTSADEYPLSGVQPEQDGTVEERHSEWVERAAIGEIGEEPTYTIKQDIPFPFQVLAVTEGDEDHGR